MGRTYTSDVSLGQCRYSSSRDASRSCDKASDSGEELHDDGEVVDLARGSYLSGRLEKQM